MHSELQSEMGGTGAIPRVEEPLSIAFPELSAGRRALRRCLRASPSTLLLALLLALPLAPARRLKCRRSARCPSGFCVHKGASTDPLKKSGTQNSTWTCCGSTRSHPDPGPASVCTLPQSPQMLRLDPAQTLEALSSCWQSSQRQRQ